METIVILYQRWFRFTAAIVPPRHKVSSAFHMFCQFVCKNGIIMCADLFFLSCSPTVTRIHADTRSVHVEVLLCLCEYNLYLCIWLKHPWRGYQISDCIFLKILFFKHVYFSVGHHGIMTVESSERGLNYMTDNNGWAAIRTKLSDSWYPPQQRLKRQAIFTNYQW